MNFAKRIGVEMPEPSITIRNDAPRSFRLFLLQLMLRYEHNLKKIRTIVCYITKEPEDPNNWGENDFMKNEIQCILENCHWYRIYEIVEEFYNRTFGDKAEFEKEINEYFFEKGFGWKLNNGVIETRGENVFEQEMTEVVTTLKEVGLETSQNEIREAIKDMSKMPTPDITGSVQHSVAALECLCREITGNKNATLGKLINDNPNIVPKPLDNVIKEIFGFASEQGRHLREGNAPNYEEAKLVVHLCASICNYLANKNLKKIDDDLMGLFK